MKKLSELSTLDGIRVMGRLTTEFNNVATNAKFKDKCSEFAEKVNQATNISHFEQFGMFADLLLNDFPDVIINILATIQDKTADDIRNQPFLTTANQVKSLAEDKDLISFFTSFIKRTPQP